MVKKLIGFRVEEEKYEGFRSLAMDSGRSVQRVLAEYVEACLGARSVEVMPVLSEKTGRLRSNNLGLRDTIQQLRGYIEQKNYSYAESRFYDLMRQMKRVNDYGLLEEAESIAASYLKWIDEHKLETGGYKPGRF